MKNNLLLALLFFFFPLIIIGQTQEAITSVGRKVILYENGTWKYAEEVTTSDGKKVILNADGTWKYAEVNKEPRMAGSNDNRINDRGISYNLAGRGIQCLPLPEYNYLSEGRVVVEVTVDRSGKVTKAVPGIRGSNTLDEYLLRVAKEAAIKSKFDANQDAPFIQKGTITYNFILR